MLISSCDILQLRTFLMYVSVVTGTKEWGQCLQYTRQYLAKYAFVKVPTLPLYKNIIVHVCSKQAYICTRAFLVILHAYIFLPLYFKSPAVCKCVVIATATYTLMVFEFPLLCFLLLLGDSQTATSKPQHEVSSASSLTDLIYEPS